MKKAIFVIIFGLLLSGNAYAGLFQKFRENGISFEEYKKRCKKVHFFTKNQWPQFVGEYGEFKVYNCMLTTSLDRQIEHQVFKNGKLYKNELFENKYYSEGDIYATLVLLGLLQGNNTSVNLSTTTNTINTDVNTTGGIFSHDMISGSNRICFYKTIGGEVAITIKSAFQCKPSLNQ